MAEATISWTWTYSDRIGESALDQCYYLRTGSDTGDIGADTRTLDAMQGCHSHLSHGI